mmetsp:Transcript_40154/g.84344  ORF Transcript_40154/g.84344 Transcript_40154/m.84344 type:complete len:249 (-) Transcript_40154:129-875(-)
MTLASTMRRRHTLKPMPLNPSLKSLPLANSRNIHILPRHEMPRMNSRPGLRHGILRRHPKLPHNIRRMFLHAKLGIMPHQRLRHPLRLAFPRPNLNRVVSIGGIGCLGPYHNVAVQKEDRARMTLAPIVPYGHHSQFDPQGAASLVAKGPFGGAGGLLLEVLEAVGHDEGAFALSRLPIAVFLAFLLLGHFFQFVVYDFLDFFFGEVGVDGVDFVDGWGGGVWPSLLESDGDIIIIDARALADGEIAH